MSSLNFKIFDYLESPNSLYSNFENLPDEVKDSYNQFLLNRLISSSPYYMNDIAQIAQYNIPNDIHYNFLYSLLKKQSHSFNMKLYKGKNINYKEIEAISKSFELGTRDSKYIYNRTGNTK